MFGGVLQTNDLPVSPNRLSLADLHHDPWHHAGARHPIPRRVSRPHPLEPRAGGIRLPDARLGHRAQGGSEIRTSVGLLGHEASKETNLLENFRVIRTNLLSMGALSKPPHVLMVTSAMPKEGKTVCPRISRSPSRKRGRERCCSTRTCAAAVCTGSSVTAKQPGLSGVLLGQVTLDEAIRPTQPRKPHRLSAGQHLESGTELLGSQKFTESCWAARALRPHRHGHAAGAGTVGNLDAAEARWMACSS